MYYFVPKHEHVYLSEENRIVSLKNFSDIFRADLPKIVDKLRVRYLTNAEKKKSIFDPEVKEEMLSRGLYAIFETKQKIIVLDNSDLANFFIYYFVFLYERSSVEARLKMRKEFVAKVIDAKQISAFFLELAVAQSFQHQGAHVELIEAGSDSGVKTPDLFVKKMGRDLYVECKCVTGSVNAQIPDRGRDEAIAMLANYARYVSKGRLDCLVSAYFKGNGESDIRSVIGDLQIALLTLDKEDEPHEVGLWGISLHRLSQQHKSWLKDDATIKAYVNNLLTFATIAANVDDIGFIALGAEDKGKLDVTIANRVQSAIEQLPKDGERLIWIQILGSSGDRQSTFAPSLQEILWKNENFASRMNRQLAKKNGFLGLIIQSDFEVETRGDKKFLNYFIFRIFENGIQPKNLAPFLLW